VMNWQHLAVKTPAISSSFQQAAFPPACQV